MFGLLSTIATTGNAIQRGIDLDKQRTAAEEDRQYQLGLRRQQEEDRARRLQIESEDRQFQVGQRQRTLDEQKRADDLRAADAAVPTTRSVVDPNLPQLDDTDNPIPENLRSREVAVPRWQQLQTMAANRRKAGMMGEALKLEDAAREEMFKDSSQRFFALKAGAEGMTAFQVAQQAKTLFDNDPYPQEVAGLQQLDGGGVRATIRNRETGQTVTQDFKDANSVLTALEGLYSPDTYRAYTEARRKTQEEINRELLKPGVLRPGDVQVSGGRVIARNTNPTAAELRYGVGGAGGGGAGARGARPQEVKSRRDQALGHFKQVWENSTLKDTASAAQLATAQRLAGQIAEENPNIDPLRAPEFAIAAATDPNAVRVAFVPHKGTMARVVTHEGSNVIIEDLGPQKIRSAEKGSLRGDADAFVATLGDRAPAYMTAAVDPSGKARRELVESIIRSPEAVAALRRENGREPTEDDFKKAFELTNKTIGAQLDLMGNHLSDDRRLELLRKSPTGQAFISNRRGAPSGEERAGPASDPITSMSDSMLRRIANMPGHARHQEAADELQLRQSQAAARRRAAQEETGANLGLGFGLGIAP